MSKTLVMESADQTTMQEVSMDGLIESLQERIQQRAYELYEARGRVDGYHEQDWARAEKEVLEPFEQARAA
jgi:DUF2934 family protein